MTPTEKQKCIAEQAVYGDLHFVNPSGNVRKLDAVSSIVAYGDKGGIFAPIIRPMSDLTKEITHKGYNDDKPFIPLVELANTAYLEIGIPSDCYDSIKFSVNPKSNGAYELAGFCFQNNMFEILDYGEVIKRSKKDEDPFVEIIHTSLNQQTYFDLLHLWHFDTRNLIEKGEAIDVNTLDINPYSV